MRKIPKLISKSKLMRGHQCQKQLYLSIHYPQLEAPITPDKQALFDQGNQVGELARTYFPGGTLVDFPPWEFVGSLKKTRELLEQETHAIYEAAFEYKGCYARADIIQYQADTQRWKIFEVKSSTSVKEEHLQDIALQAWIMAKAGLPIEAIHLVHINRECRHPELKNLFQIVDVTDQVRKIYPDIHTEINQSVKTIREEEVPRIEIGEHCMKPYECGFKDHCFKEALVPSLSVLDLPKIYDKKWGLFEKGLVSIDELYKSEDFSELPESTQRIIKAHQSNENYADLASVKDQLKNWQGPLYFFDFETVATAIPKYLNCRPYEQVPFQWSLHKLDLETNDLDHSEFLWDEDTDPRPQLIEAMLESLGQSGSIVAYYAQFETTRIKEMAETFPHYSEALLALVDRFVDPLPVIREHIYLKEFAGSYSLKKVAPALLGDKASYQGLTVADGLAAQVAYKNLIKETNTDKKTAIKKDLLEYCKQDTLVMVELYKRLKGAESL